MQDPEAVLVLKRSVGKAAEQAKHAQQAEQAKHA